MRKVYKIRYNDIDKQLIYNTVRNFNRKIDRILKNNPELKDFLPNKINVSSVKDKVYSRKDFNRTIKSFQNFSKKGVEKPILTKHNIKTTEWELKETRKKVNLLNRKRQRIRKEKQKQAISYNGTMGTIRENSLKPKKFNIDNIRLNTWNKFNESLEKQLKSDYSINKLKEYKENFKKAVKNVFDDKEINKMIDNIDPDKLVNAYFENPLLHIDFVYDPLSHELKKETLISELQNLIE